MDGNFCYDINYQVQSVHRDQIDYEYLIRLIQNQVPSDEEPLLVRPTVEN